MVITVIVKKKCMHLCQVFMVFIEAIEGFPFLLHYYLVKDFLKYDISGCMYAVYTLFLNRRKRQF